MSDIEAFIARWQERAGGAELSNYQSFVIELCTVLALKPPDPAARASTDNDYVFERHVRSFEGDGPFHRVDVYKRGCFILEAKQSFRADGAASRLASALRDQGVRVDTRVERDGGDGRLRGWNRLMQGAMEQARRYAWELPPDHPSPPFLIACDVGRAFELWADFTGTGRGYAPFPDRKRCRVFLEDLRDPNICARLTAVWCDPHSLDPAHRKLKVTREIAEELAAVWKTLEVGSARTEVARFLMRCILTMFACSVGLLPGSGLCDLLVAGIDNPRCFAPQLAELWRKMSDPDYEHRYFAPFDAHVPYFGPDVFHHSTVLVLPEASLEALLRAARRSWDDVEPAIFGTLLENALDGEDRKRLGAHYTPRPHVERVVEATVMAPLREDWRLTAVAVEAARDDGDLVLAQRLARDFQTKLRSTRVLDPACGTGNFLYVALDLMKGLEAQVLETLALTGAVESLGIDAVDPRQFLGIEVNASAALIAGLVLRIGYFQLHYRTNGGHPAEPILRGGGTIERRNAVAAWAGAEHGTSIMRNGVVVEVRPDAYRPDWPEAEFIVGNPPFMGGKDLRARLGNGEAEALWAANPRMNRSADLVMYWWDHAAELLAQKGSALRRFGFVTTNSITQAFQRQTVERHLQGPRPIHLTYVIPDHPWTPQGSDPASVRVSMTVAEAGCGDGVRLELISETPSDAGEPILVFTETRGAINSDLSIGVDLTRVEPLLANRGVCSPGVKLHGAGFIVSLEKARALGLGRRAGLEDHIRPYRNGRDIVQKGRDAWVIDLYPLPAEQVRTRFPEVYQHLLATVKPERDANRMAFRREHWWWFGATHEMYRSFTLGLDRYIATPETAKHRIFVFLPSGVRADNMLVNVGLSDGFHLGVLTSRVHTAWARATGAVLEDRPRYTKSACFDPFPFPVPVLTLRQAICAAAEELDATRAQVQAEHPELTLTAIYNGVELLRAGLPVGDDLRARGRVAILSELHARLDALVLESYGWPQELATSDILGRLAALNLRRRAEERDGRVLWLRPSYQEARFGRTSSPGRLDGGQEPDLALRLPAQPVFPSASVDQPVAVLRMLEEVGRPVSANDLCALFDGRRNDRLRKVATALMTLARYGRISVLEDGRCLARRSA